MKDKTVYPQRESKVLEFKSTVTKFDALVKTSIAFANGVGGKIVVGVDDKTRAILGVDEELREKVYERFPSSLYDLTSPRLVPQIYEQWFGGEAVLVIEIPPCLKKPCVLRSAGLPKGVYLRVGSTTRSAGEEHVEELMRENQRLFFDEEVVPIELNHLSDELLSVYYQPVKQAALLEDKVIARAVVNREIFHPTVAGLLLFAERPELYLPEALIICTRFAGSSGRDIIQTEEIKGPISKQIDVSFKLVASWLKRNYRLEGARLEAASLVPDAALREGIINAVMHRKYTIPGATKIALYDDRLEIFSPGNFPGHVNVNNLGEGITHLRNPTLARMAHKMGLIEKLGSGLRLMMDSCAQAKIALPEFSEDGDYVKVIFRFQPLVTAVESDEERVLALLRLREAVKIHDIIAHLERSRTTVFKVLNRLVEKKLVQSVGKGPATRYALTERH